MFTFGFSLLCASCGHGFVFYDFVSERRNGVLCKTIVASGAVLSFGESVFCAGRFHGGINYKRMAESGCYFLSDFIFTA